MSDIFFWKMSGSGNDFLVIDNRENILDGVDLPVFAAKVCRRKMSVGADGIFVIAPSEKADFKWHFFNSDGSRAEMCGNASRCAARFAVLNRIAGPDLSFETDAGIIHAKVDGEKVKVRLTDPFDLRLNQTIEIDNREYEYGFVNTGVPHVVIETAGIQEIDIKRLGRKIRFHERFSPAGANVNFMARHENGNWLIRTYERGVEDETLACGTGVAAAALIRAVISHEPSPLTFQVRSGSSLSIYFQKLDSAFTRIYLEGDARIIYQGVLKSDAFMD